MTAPFPHRYEISLRWSKDAPATVEAGPRPPLVVGAPPEFEGEDRFWSPEHLLLASLASCLTTTYAFLLRRESWQPTDFRCTARGLLEKTREGIVFTSMTLDVTLVVAPEHSERAIELLHRAKKSCIVAATLKPPVDLSLHVASAPPLAPDGVPATD
jgi:organic hydroperoxide reductase OsmC/OhrA